jgi:hypothetical protein
MLEKLTFGHRFNQSLANSLDNLISLTHLIFSHYFNQSLSNSLDNLISLKHLTLGYAFNQSFEIHSNIKILTINCNNINLIENLPSSIEELYFDVHFYLELNHLPNSIKIIKFNKNSYYNKELNNLPIQLEILELPVRYNLKIKNIYPNCKIVR